MTPGPDAIVIGAGPAGLACAVTLGKIGMRVTVLEKTQSVGSSWRRHYDRLHLHTDRNHSGLPGMAMPGQYPTYPSRDQVVAYLEAYAAHFKLEPTFNTSVSRIGRDGAHWRADTSQGPITAPVMVIATGIANTPYRPSWTGFETYAGEMIHSSDYKNAAQFAGKRVLVVGFGNSGGEIALDLAEANVDVTMSVRSAVQILPRDLLGFPILSWAILYRRLPARLVDAVNAPVLRLAIGNIERLGLRRAAKGPRQMVEQHGRVPLIDIGTLAKIRDGAIAVRDGIDRFTTQGVVFAGAKTEMFDAVILATGYRPDLQLLIPGIDGVFDRHGLPLITGRPTAAPGLYFCSQITVPTGQLREIGIEAQRIAKVATAYVARAA